MHLWRPRGGHFGQENDQFHDSFECFSPFFVPNRRPGSIALLSGTSNTKEFTCKLDCSHTCLARALELTSR